MQKEYAELFGYKVYNNGDIFGLHNNKLKQTKAIRVKKDGVFVAFSILRFIYYAFNQDSFDINDYNYVVIPKDKNKNNRHIDNLLLVKKKTIVQGDCNNCSKLNNRQVEEILHKYKNNLGSYRSLAQEYNVSHSLIWGIVKGKYRNKKLYKLK